VIKLIQLNITSVNGTVAFSKPLKVVILTLQQQKQKQKLKK